MPLPEPDVQDIQLRTNLEYLDRALSGLTGAGEIGGAAALVPAGAITGFAGANAPAGWLLCQGQSLERAAYPRLFTAIGTTYGSVDSAHFTLPNMQGKVAVGVSTSDTDFDLADTGGAKTNTHNHFTPFSNDGTSFFNVLSGATPRTRTATKMRAILSAAVSSGLTREDSTYDETIDIMQPFLALNYIIKT